jgi:hypothetical protein
MHRGWNEVAVFRDAHIWEYITQEEMDRAEAKEIKRKFEI